MNLEKFCLKTGTTIMTMGMLMGFCGCTEAQDVEGPKKIVMTIDTPVDSPIMKIDSVKTDIDLEIFTKDNIEGLILKDGIYYYDLENPYGGNDGDIAGFYKSEVYNEGKKVGAVCFDEEICHEILDNALSKIPKNEKKIKIILPLDITNYNGDFKVELSRGEYKWYACFFDEKLDFVDNCPWSSVYMTTSSPDNSFMVTENDSITDMTQLMMNMDCFRSQTIEYHNDLNSVFYFFSTKSLDYDAKYESVFGQSLCQVDNSLLICLGEKDEEGNFNSIKMPNNSLLTLDDGSLVFIKKSSGFIFFNQDFQKEE